MVLSMCLIKFKSKTGKSIFLSSVEPSELSKNKIFSYNKWITFINTYN